VLYERELKVINSEILKRKYTHVYLNVNRYKFGGRGKRNNAIGKGLLITGEKPEEEQHHKESTDV
jgi:hypothetical protein